jgi:hypothetical protein
MPRCRGYKPANGWVVPTLVGINRRSTPCPLAHSFTTILPAMPPRGDRRDHAYPSHRGSDGAHTVLVTTRSCRALHHPIAAVGLSGMGKCRCVARCRWRTMMAIPQAMGWPWHHGGSAILIPLPPRPTSVLAKTGGLGASDTLKRCPLAR